MADIQQCFRCGEYGHIQLTCQNEDNVDARKTLNELSREKRTKSKNDEYQKKWDLRKQAMDTFNGDMALLNRFVNGSLDLLQEVQGDLADVVFDNLDNLSDSAEKLRKLKQKLEEKLPELREVIYLAKHFKGEHPNSEERAIFDARAFQLDKLRNHVWNHLWKTEKRAAYAVTLVGKIRENRRYFELYAGFLHAFTQSKDNQSMLAMYEKLKDIEATLLVDFASLSALVKDERIQAEKDAYQYFLCNLRAIMGFPREMRDYKIIGEDLLRFQRRNTPF